MNDSDENKAHLIFEEMRTNRKEGINKLYKSYYRTIYGISFSILKNKEDSEEVVQNVLMKLLRVDNEKLPTRNELSWTYKVVKNASINYIRSQKHLENIDDIYYTSREDTDIEKIIDSDKFNRIISGLNNDEKEIVSLKIISDLSFNEIATITKQPEGTVKWKYYKAVNTMKTIISSISMLSITTIIFVKTMIPKRPTYNVLPIPGAIPTIPEEENIVEEPFDWSMLLKIILPILMIIFASSFGYFMYNYLKQSKIRKKNNKY